MTHIGVRAPILTKFPLASLAPTADTLPAWKALSKYPADMHRHWTLQTYDALPVLWTAYAMMIDITAGPLSLCPRHDSDCRVPSLLSLRHLDFKADNIVKEPSASAPMLNSPPQSQREESSGHLDKFANVDYRPVELNSPVPSLGAPYWL
ncbi:uncharacterized protein ARMOST_02539 [Armillaria ostoyae]|uniref:Uncharacterized protein n=1 Tax=Armillaria ostoyae TaxID=47428 RepID=A0A284QRZ0_ARMOS|nr:uncharacterized protein ARMOST_02539 [Armillaria ostoyae]